MNHQSGHPSFPLAGVVALLGEAGHKLHQLYVYFDLLQQWQCPGAAMSNQFLDNLLLTSQRLWLQSACLQKGFYAQSLGRFLGQKPSAFCCDLQYSRSSSLSHRWNPSPSLISSPCPAPPHLWSCCRGVSLTAEVGLSILSCTWALPPMVRLSE